MSNGAIPRDQASPYRLPADEVLAGLGTDARRGLGREEAQARAEALAAIDGRVQERVRDAAQAAQAGEPADERLVFDLMFVGQRP